MFFDILIKNKKNLNDSIKENILNIFSQRQKIINKKKSLYHYYGIPEIKDYSPEGIKNYCIKIENIIKNYETRIKELNLKINIDGFELQFLIKYTTFKDHNFNELLILLKK